MFLFCFVLFYMLSILISAMPKLNKRQNPEQNLIAAVNAVRSKMLSLRKASV